VRRTWGSALSGVHDRTPRSRITRHLFQGGQVEKLHQPALNLQQSTGLETRKQTTHCLQLQTQVATNVFPSIAA